MRILSNLFRYQQKDKKTYKWFLIKMRDNISLLCTRIPSFSSTHFHEHMFYFLNQKKIFLLKIFWMSWVLVTQAKAVRASPPARLGSWATVFSIFLILTVKKEGLRICLLCRWRKISQTPIWPLPKNPGCYFHSSTYPYYYHEKES